MDEKLTTNEEEIKKMCNDPFYVFLIFSMLSMFPGEQKEKMQNILDEFKEFCNEQETRKRNLHG